MDYRNYRDYQTTTQSAYPQIKIYTFGEFRLERRSSGAERPPSYQAIAHARLAQRSSALIMLKVLLCQPRRRIARTALAALMWPGQANSHYTTHTIDTAASLLRRHVLNTSEQGSLLFTQRLGGETVFTLAEQARLWLDADELLSLAHQAVQRESEGEDARPTLNAAHALAQGEFLEEELTINWTQPLRQTIDGARRRVLHHLVDVYTQSHQYRHAEELLFSYLQEYPTDQDALYRLMNLLNQQQRRQEALHIFHYCSMIINDHQQQADDAINALAAKIQHNCKLHEAAQYYSTPVRYSMCGSCNITYTAIYTIGYVTRASA